MKKLDKGVYMSNETSTSEERLEILKLVKELGYNVNPVDLDATLKDVRTFPYLEYCKELDKWTLCISVKARLVNYHQILGILADSEDDHSAVYKALGKVRSGHHLPEVGKTKEPTIQEATEILHAACKRAGIVVKTLLFEMP